MLAINGMGERRGDVREKQTRPFDVVVVVTRASAFCACACVGVVVGVGIGRGEKSMSTTLPQFLQFSHDFSEGLRYQFPPSEWV